MIANSQRNDGLTCWDRMYQKSKNRAQSQNKSVAELKLDKSSNELLKYTKQSRNDRVKKHNSEDRLASFARMHEKAMEHHQYIKNKMKEKGKE